MVTQASFVRRSLMALAMGLVVVASAQAGSADRTYLFGDDDLEAPTVGGTPSSPGIGTGQLTLDSTFFNTVGFTDASDLSYTGGPTYFNAGSGALARPGAATGTFGLQFNGSSDNLFRDDRGLGVPAQADDNYVAGTNNAPGYGGGAITTRYIDGWVRPTTGAGTRRDVINDTARFGIFIGTDNNWGFRNGTTTVNTSTPAASNTWTHVMHHTFGAGGGAALLVNGIAVAATPNGYSTAAQPAADLPIVFGAGLNKTSNFFAGQLDDFVLGVAGNNTGAAGGRNYGPLTLATDNAFIRQNLMGVNPGDINRDGTVNSTDVNTFVMNWRRSPKQVNGVTVGDLDTRLSGDLNMNGTVDIDDAFTLHFALRSAGVAAGLDFGLLGVSVPEPGSILLGAIGIVAFGMAGRRRR
jgi:hypothetical protein